MLAFHGDPAIKAKYLDQLRAHAAADEIIKGQYWKNGKGCAVGCTIHGFDHSAYETALGIPKWLAQLEDWLFEVLPNHDAKTLPARFLVAIPVGADLAPTRDQFLAWLMDSPEYGLAHHAPEQEIRDLAAEVARRLRYDADVEGPDADALTQRLRPSYPGCSVTWNGRDGWNVWKSARAVYATWQARAASARDNWEVWNAWAARYIPDAWANRAARTAFIKASTAELLRLLAAAERPTTTPPQERMHV